MTTAVSSDLSCYIQRLSDKSKERFGKGLGYAVEPYKQIIGKRCYELALVGGADGVLVELMRFVNVLEGVEDFDWEEW